MKSTELPPEDRAPVPSPRRVSRGLLAAVALATVVLAIATFVAFRSGGDDTATERIGAGGTLPPYEPGSLEPTVDVEGDALPPLEYETFDGATTELSTNGRPLVINFWAAYCGPCVAEMPAIEQAYQANREQVDVLGLQVQEAARLGLDMAERTGVTYPLGRDVRGDVVRELGGMNLPTTVFVAADGTIADVHVGAVTVDELQALIDEHLLT